MAFEQETQSNLQGGTKKLNVKLNKYIIYTFTFTYKFVLYLSILPLIYTQEGLSISQVSAITIIGHLAIFLFEVPTGVLADTIGKKKSVLLGILIDCLALLFIMLCSKSLVTFVIWIMIQSLGLTLISGADSAMIFEYLKRNSSEEQYHKVTSNMSFLARMSSFIATLICGRLVEISFNTVLIITLVFKLISLILMGLFKDDGITEEKKEKKDTQCKYFDTVKNGMNFIKKDKTFLYYSMFNVVLLHTVGILWEYRSLIVSEKTNLSITIVSIIVSVLNLVLAFSFLLSKRMHKQLERDTKSRFYLVIPVLFILISFLPNYYSLTCFVLFIVLNAIYSPYMNYKMNSSIQNDECRATLLSIMSALDSVVYAMTVGIFGLLNKVMSMNTAFAVLGVGFIICYFMITSIKTED